MLNKYGGTKKKLKNNITDQYKLNCIKDYVINKELRNDYHNYYPFAMSHWYPISLPISPHYQVQRRIDPKNNTGIIIAHDWHKKQDDINVDRDKDITFYVPQVIMEQARYKSAILQHCTDQLFNPDNEKYGHLQLEILPFTKKVGRRKLEANSMRMYYDLFVIRGCQSLDEKLEIWHEMIDLFANKLQLLTTVSMDDNPNISR